VQPTAKMFSNNPVSKPVNGGSLRVRECRGILNSSPPALSDSVAVPLELLGMESATGAGAVVDLEARARARNSCQDACAVEAASREQEQEPPEAWMNTPAVQDECAAGWARSLTWRAAGADLDPGASEEAAAAEDDVGWMGRSGEFESACRDGEDAEAFNSNNESNNNNNKDSDGIGLNGLTTDPDLGSVCSVPRDGPACSVPRDGPACSVPRDGPACSVPRDGPACSVPRDGPACSVPRDGPACCVRVREQAAVFARTKVAAEAAVATLSATSRLRSPSPSPRARPWYRLGLERGTARALAGGRRCSLQPLSGEEEEEDFGFVCLEKSDMCPSTTESDGWMHVTCEADDEPAEPLLQQHQGRSIPRPAETSVGNDSKEEAVEDGWEWHWDHDVPPKPLGVDYLREVLATLAQDPAGPRMRLSQAMAPSKQERIVVDQAARVQHVNDAWQHKFGFLRKEVVGTLLSAFQAEQLCRCMQIIPLVQDDNQKEVQVFLAQVVQGPLQDDDVLCDL